MHTYFIHAPITNRVKIGRSITPDTRIRSILTASPDDLVFIGAIEGDYELEMHRRFASARKRGEWFEITEELAAFLKARFGCVLPQGLRARANVAPIESWQHIINRAEEAFGYGLRQGGDYFELAEVLYSLCYEYEGAEGVAAVEAGEDEQSYELDRINGDLEEWWPWLLGWNLIRHPEDGEDEVPDLLLLFRKPDNAPKIEHLCRDLAVWGGCAMSEPQVALRVAFVYRARTDANEWIGELLGPAEIDDEGDIWCNSLRSINPAILYDQVFGFRLLGDDWYRRLGLKTPAENGLIGNEMATDTNANHPNGPASP